jgi:hypothetical protein
MEKLLYPVWKRDGLACDDWRDALLSSFCGAVLAMANVRALRIAVVDSAVEEAADKRMQTCQPLPDGLVSIWVNNAGERAAIDELIAAQVARFTCYLIVEAEPIVNTLYPSKAGERGYGFCQVVFLQRPERLSESQWLTIWQGSHTQVAIDTQATFSYRQNVIARSLSAEAPVFHAVIEENFPPEAMTSDHAFYGLPEGDDEGLKANLGAMMESCSRFIDFDKIDVIPMSEYVVKDFLP